MIHGKFFTGLPERMMNRANGPDRQKSRLFWPDEEKLVPATQNQRNLRKGNNKHYNNNVSVQETIKDSEGNHIAPKELFQKQLTSKIEFYDLEETPKHEVKNHLKNSEQPYNNKKRETFSSKIEFYDFDDDKPVQASMTKVDCNSKVEIEKLSQNSPKVYEKRITFIDNTSKNKTSKPKGIMKNNGSASNYKSWEENVKKRNISKSAENLSRSKSASNIPNDGLDNIVNDVKNIVLNNEVDEESFGNTFQLYDEAPIPEKMNCRKRDVKVVARQNTTTYNDDTKRFAKVESSLPQSDTSCSTRQTYRKEYEDHNDSGIISHKQERRTRIYNDPGFEPSMDYASFHNIHSIPVTLSDEPCVEESIKTGSHERYHEIYADTSDNTHNNRIPDFEEVTTINNRLNCIRSQNRNEDYDQSIQGKSATSPRRAHSMRGQPTQRAHRHLVSNISFGNDDQSTAHTQRRPARNHAVSRVSVGLPD